MLMLLLSQHSHCGHSHGSLIMNAKQYQVITDLEIKQSNSGWNLEVHCFCLRPPFHLLL